MRAEILLRADKQKARESPLGPLVQWNLLLALIGRGERQQGDLTRAFDRVHGDPLVLGAVAGSSSRHDLAAIRYESAKFGGVLVVYRVYLVRTERADSAARSAELSARATTIATGATATTSSTGSSSSGWSHFL